MSEGPLIVRIDASPLVRQVNERAAAITAEMEEVARGWIESKRRRNGWSRSFTAQDHETLRTMGIASEWTPPRA